LVCARFALKTPRFEGLEFLGFPWILSSETRLINGLHGIFAEKFFVTPFAPWRVRNAKTEGRWRGYAEAQKCSSSELSVDSDFLQLFVARPFPPAASSGLSQSSSEGPVSDPERTFAARSIRSGGGQKPTDSFGPQIAEISHSMFRAYDRGHRTMIAEAAINPATRSTLCTRAVDILRRLHPPPG
jgi:hypothetical protein